MAGTSAEKRVAKELITLLGEKDTFLKDFSRVNGLYESPKKVAKPLEGLAGSTHLFKEPRAAEKSTFLKDFRHIDTLFNDKKVSYAPLEGLEGCMNLFPRTYNKKTRGH